MQDLYFKEDEEPTVRLFNPDKKHKNNIEAPLLLQTQGSLKNSKITAPLYRSSQLTAKKNVPKYSIKIHCQSCDFYGYSHVEQRKNVYIRWFAITVMIEIFILFVIGLLFLSLGSSSVLQMALFVNLGLMAGSLVAFFVMLVRSGHRIDHSCMKCGTKF